MNPDATGHLSDGRDWTPRDLQTLKEQGNPAWKDLVPKEALVKA